MEEETLRVRVVFDDRKILTKSQRSEGLKRCWLLLKRPAIATVSDLASYLLTSFNLQRSCPHGLFLSMDDFVLPPFESTSILKDKDIIRVRKKDATPIDLIELGDYPCEIQCPGVLERQNTVPIVKLLGIREFGENSGRETSNDEELCAHNKNAINTGTKSKRKVKHPDGIEGSKRKKLKTSSMEPNTHGDDEEDTAVGDEDTHLGKSLESSKGTGSSRRASNKKAELFSLNGNITSQLEGNVEQGTCSDQRVKRGKKSRLTSPEKIISTAEGAENIPREQKQSSSQKEVNVARDLDMKDKQSGEDGTCSTVVASKPGDNVSKKHSFMLMEERNALAKKDIGVATCEPHVNDNVTKIQSRSTRRKKAKRKWLVELKSKEAQNNKSQVSPKVTHKESPEQQEIDQATEPEQEIVPVSPNVTCKESPEQQQIDQDTEQEKEIVPVVIRPGHIRFQPLDEECSKEQSEDSMETFQWNGTTSKKKGQKWGREKMTGNWNNENGYTEVSIGKMTASKWNHTNGYKGEKCARDMTMTKLNDSNGYNEQSNRMENTMNGNAYTEQHNAKVGKGMDANGEQSDENALSEKGQRGDSEIDFESLLPLTRIPQVGDVLAYRLIELSSSWCPEVSPYRVGQVTSYNHISMSIILVPVREYPIFSAEDKEGRDSMLQENSLYKEDDSLQIHYLSLVDVRLLKASYEEATTSDSSEKEASNKKTATVNNEISPSSKADLGRQVNSNETAASPMNNSELVNNNAKEIVGQPIENGNASESAWDQIKQALVEKKAQLQKKNDIRDEGTPNKSTAATSWTYRALRRSAVGPTLAFLRGKNDENHGKK